jgi:drug/metabolite transporter (DMT)-like permease
VAPEQKSRLIGYLSLMLTVAIWGAWIVFTRETVTHFLSPATVAFLRVTPAAIILSPWIWRAGIFASGKIGPLILCVIGAGAPFVFLAAYGTRYATSADFAALVPGTLPLIVALISTMIFKEKMGALRAAGFVFAAVGVFVVAGRSLIAGDHAANFGHVLLLSASFVYAIYTFAFRRSGLTPIEATGVIAFWSSLMTLPFGVPEVIELVRAGHLHEVLFQAVLQGLLSGLIALVAYNTGIERLGASKAAAFVALVPVVATLIAIPILGERPDIAGIIGVVMTSLGVLLASGILAPIGKNGRTPAG